MFQRAEIIVKTNPSEMEMNEGKTFGSFSMSVEISIKIDDVFYKLN